MNDYRQPGGLPPKKDNRGLWIFFGVFAAVALIAVLYSFGTQTATVEVAPVSETAAGMEPSTVEPAADAAATATEPPVATASDSPAAPVETTNPVENTTGANTYASEEECKTATDAPCHFVTCDAVPEGKQPEEVCGADFKQGWQPVVASPDKTNVPEEVAPPLTGQGNEPHDPTPPLTGQ